jgi:hypothetical protein
MPRADAPLRDVLVADGPDESIEVAASGTAGGNAALLPAVPVVLVPLDDEQWRWGDRLLLGFFVLVGTVGLTLSLWPGMDAALAAECSPNATCTYTEGRAFYHGVDSASTWEEGGREGCCRACDKHSHCVAATYLDATATATVPTANCIMYTTTAARTVAVEGASLCLLPSEGAAASAARGSLEYLLGASALVVRFGGIAFSLGMSLLLGLAGYKGASLPQTVLSPRQAGVAAARVAADAESGSEVATAVPAAAGWEAIAANQAAQPRLVMGDEQVEVRFRFGPRDRDLDCTGEIAALSSADLQGKLALTIRGDKSAADYVKLADRAEQAAAAGALALLVVNDRTPGRVGRGEATIPVFAVGESVGAALAGTAEPAQLTMAAFGQPPPTWTAARQALGLSVRQVVWSSGTKLLLWHWSQPLSYFAVFGAYFCSLPVDDDFTHDQRFLGTWVAVREVMYVLSTLLALWLNPAYLLMELGSVWKEEEPAEAAGGGCCRCGRWLRSVDPAALKQLVLYFLAPHHYVTLCLMRWADSTGRGALHFLFALIGAFQGVGDLFSAGAMYSLLQQPAPPSALAIGYWLTTAGLVVAIGWLALLELAKVWTGRDPNNGRELPWGDRSAGLFGLLFTVAMFLGGASLLVLAPLQLGGAVRGLAPPCDSWLC